MAFADLKGNPSKTGLSIKLTESAVFLRSASHASRANAQPSVVRGLLTLQLAKATKISSIELELYAKVASSWSEGVGARRMEVNEEHKVFSAKTILFRAREESTSQRRAMSLGPAAMYDTALVDDDDVTEVEGRGRRRSSFLFQPDHGQENYNGFLQEIDDSPTPSRDPSTARGSRTADVNSRQNRQVMTTDNPPTYQEATPPPSRSGSVDRPALSPAHSSRYLEYLSTVHENPALALQESRDHLLADLDLSRRNSSNAGVPQLPASSSSSSIRSFSHSRRPSIEDVPEDLVISRSNNQRVPSVSQPRSPSLSGTPNDSAEAVRSPSESRGRKSGRFSFTSVGSALLDAVRSTSSRSRDAGERAGTSKGITSATEEPGSFRGRRMERTVAPDAPPSRERTREEPAIFAGMGSDLVGGESSKEFKKGTYKYAISFTIPGHAPPSLDANYGSVTWMLKAAAHRPGTFTSKLAASHPVIVVSGPAEEDTDDTDNVIVERHWDNQLQYLLAVSGKSFYIGGTIPITFTLLPLAKVKIHRIMVYLEEKTEYHSNFTRKVARGEPIHRTALLIAKDDHKDAPAILPLQSDDPNILRSSPLATFIPPNPDEVEAESELSEMTSSLMGPGPWTLHKEMQLPRNCRTLRFTNKNRRSNITITHVLKCMIRVERGDDSVLDEKTGKRKLFDIVVQIPIHILSCRCNPEWTWLPHYSDINDDDTSALVSKCPCQSRPAAPHHHPSHPPSHPSSDHYDSDSSAITVESRDVNPSNMRSLRSHLPPTDVQTYQQLVSGDLTEAGEAPPAYSS